MGKKAAHKFRIPYVPRPPWETLVYRARVLTAMKAEPMSMTWTNVQRMCVTSGARKRSEAPERQIRILVSRIGECTTTKRPYGQSDIPSE